MLDVPALLFSSRSGCAALNQHLHPGCPLEGAKEVSQDWVSNRTTKLFAIGEENQKRALRARKAGAQAPVDVYVCTCLTVGISNITVNSMYDFAKLF